MIKIGKFAMKICHDLNCCVREKGEVAKFIY